MTEEFQLHTFHIPVMGTGYTIDTPVKVAHLGISSVISIVDDILIENMRAFYSRKFQIPYNEINNKIEDFRANRITAYLNLVNTIVREKYDNLVDSVHEKEDEIREYIELLPDFSEIKVQLESYLKNNTVKEDLQEWIRKHLPLGSIDVNIMTKVDKENYFKNEKLPYEYNDAAAALRGYAESDLTSSVIFSAGMNPRLYGYIENFDDFYPDDNGFIKKKIVLKVSDYRSALIQGKFLAKKGLWVSEFRIESGLNCGGHAFATNGLLMGPILEEFKNSRKELTAEMNEILRNALKNKQKTIPGAPLNFNVTAQGGVGTDKEHSFLLNYYGVDSVGWGSPFLLVPDVVNIEEDSLRLIAEAKEEDLYLSKISPLGVPFNNVRGNTKDLDKQRLISEGRPGSTCPKQLLISSTEFTDRPLCTASKNYQKQKLNQLSEKDLNAREYAIEFKKITEKACLCLGLSDTAMARIKHKKKEEVPSFSICPGPNIAYFTKKIDLKSMVDHIYGRKSILERKDRPNMFIKELSLYVNYFKDLLNNVKTHEYGAEIKKLKEFRNNLMDGIHYYEKLFIKNINRISGKEIEEVQDMKQLKNEIKEIQPEEILS